ncbi:MAG: flagellar protein FlgN [Deltaproteobacteria bacterium]|nr:flagellar protein FlgN [Deltaproteobacteria bacterium]
MHNDLGENVELYALYDGLLSVLGMELEVYRELRTVIAREKDILIKPSLEVLNESNSKKETCILKAKMLEEARTNNVKKIAKCLGIENDNINLTTLSSYANDKLREELKANQDDLSSLLMEIRRLNKINKDLLDSSLSFLKGSIDFINELMSSGSTYRNTGKVTILPRNGKILQTEG